MKKSEDIVMTKKHEDELIAKHRASAECLMRAGQEFAISALIQAAMTVQDVGARAYSDICLAVRAEKAASELLLIAKELASRDLTADIIDKKAFSYGLDEIRSERARRLALESYDREDAA